MGRLVRAIAALARIATAAIRPFAAPFGWLRLRRLRAPIVVISLSLRRLRPLRVLIAVAEIQMLCFAAGALLAIANDGASGNDLAGIHVRRMLLEEAFQGGRVVACVLVRRRQFQRNFSAARCSPAS